MQNFLEKFTIQDSDMLQQANKLAYANKVKWRIRQTWKQTSLGGIYSNCGCI